MECYRNAYKELLSDEFYAMKLKVAGEGEMLLASYFPSVSKFLPGQPNRVIHGGVKLDTRKSTVFMLWFYDRVDDKPVYLRVTSKQVDEYRFRGFFNDTLNQKDADNFNVFALGHLVLSDTGKSFRLEIDHLKYLTLFAAKKKS